MHEDEASHEEERPSRHADYRWFRYVTSIYSFLGNSQRMKLLFKGLIESRKGSKVPTNRQTPHNGPGQVLFGSANDAANIGPLPPTQHKPIETVVPLPTQLILPLPGLATKQSVKPPRVMHTQYDEKMEDIIQKLE